VPRERHPHTSPEVMASVLLPPGFEPLAEPTGGISYRDLDDPTTGELSLRRFLSGIAHAPSPQVAAELHLHSGDGSRRWTSNDEPTTLDGAEATVRTFADAATGQIGAVVTAHLGETLISVRAVWPEGNRQHGHQLSSMIDSIRLLALEDLNIQRHSLLHPVFSISVARPADWRITKMDEESWEFAFPGGSCSLHARDTGHDLSAATVEEVSRMLEGITPDGAVRGAVATRPSATRSPIYACEWSLDNAAGIAAVLLREIPILINMTSSEPTHLAMLREFIDGLRTHPALY
jgi:hypothetical protein